MKQGSCIFTLISVIAGLCLNEQAQATGATKADRQEYDDLCSHFWATTSTNSAHDSVRVATFKETDFVANVCTVPNDKNGRQTALEIASVLDKADFEWGVELVDYSNTIYFTVPWDNESRFRINAVELLKVDAKLNKDEISIGFKRLDIGLND